MSKYSVRRPFTVVVGMVLVVVLGIVCFTRMSTDLFPSMEMPYIMVMTTYPGASPERVESDVTEVLESGLGTVNGVEGVTSTSSENFSMIFLEFEEDTNMDSAMVRLTTEMDLLTLPDDAGTPMLLELSPDMVATLMAAVDYEGMDIYELTEFTNDEIVPYLERQDGVASVDPSGLVEKYVEVRLNQDKIDEINTKLIEKADDTLADAEQELADAQQELADAQQELNDSKSEVSDAIAELDDAAAQLDSQQTDTANELAQYSKLMDEAVATQKAYETNLATLQANQAALTAEKEEYTKAYDQVNESLGELKSSVSLNMKATVLNEILGGLSEEERAFMGDLPASVDASDADAVESLWTQLSENELLSSALAETNAMLDSLPSDIDDALADDGLKLTALQSLLTSLGQEEAAEQFSKETLTTLQEGYESRVPAIDVELSNLDTEIMVAEAALEQVNEAVQDAVDQYESVEAGKITAAASFGALQAQISSGQSQLESSETQLDSAQEQLDSSAEQLEDAEESLEDARRTALDNANLDSLLTISMLSGILTAEDFDMPAGYIYQDDDQVLLKVGEEISSVEELENMMLTHIDDVGDVRICDVADVTVLDNSGDSYAVVNGNQAVMISVTKTSTAGTSDVSDTVNEALDELEEKYEGLHFTALMDQGDYIDLIVNAVISNLLWGALLAIIVLALFLRDVRPTVVVAFSIPLSVLFAIVLMYFTNVTLNMISLSGLALGVGMLVDNSIVVMENIYRMRAQGVPAARAAVKGARQVSGAIIASTLTTMCVFLPIVFTTGLVRQLMMDMALTIAYSLGASLIMAMTVVPMMSSSVLKNSVEKPHRWFDAVLNGYEKVLRFFLRVKAVPLAVVIALFVFCVYQVVNMGIILIPDMGGMQMTLSFSAPEDTTDEEAYEKADEVMNYVMNLSGVETIGIMDNGSSMISGMSLLGGDSGISFSGYIELDEETGNDNSVIEKQIDEYFEDSDWEYSVSGSTFDISSLMSSGLSIDISGEELETLLDISEDVMDLVGQVEGFENISNGQEDAALTYKVVVDKDEAMTLGLTVAQIYQEIATDLTTESTAVTLNTEEEGKVEVHIVDETDPLTLDNLMDLEFEVTTMNDDGEEEKETHILSEFASLEESFSVGSITREDNVRHITVSADTMDGYNTTLLSRDLEPLLDEYEAPEGYNVEIGGESVQVMDMMGDMGLMIAMAIIFIYMIMVAQFQSLLSPFIVLFTLPLAFTGGLLALLLTGEQLSMIAMMGFLVLTGVVVNNGIVFVDYANQLRLAGMEKREALVQTGRRRMRPILMTALTTILAMFAMATDTSASGMMMRGMAIVTIGGLAYATLMTLFIVPVLYDILFRRELKPVDLGDLESLDDNDIL